MEDNMVLEDIGHPLTSLDCHKDLGVTFDCNLNFTTYF